MNTNKRTVILLSNCWDELERNLRVDGFDVDIVDDLRSWNPHGRPVQATSFLFDGLSVPVTKIELLLISWHLQSPKPLAVVIVPKDDPLEFQKRFGGSHLCVHRHDRDDWNASRAHLAGERYHFPMYAA